MRTDCGDGYGCGAVPGDDAENIPNGGEPCGRKNAPTNPERCGTDPSTAAEVDLGVGVGEGLGVGAGVGVGVVDGVGDGDCDGDGELFPFANAFGVAVGFPIAFAVASSERTRSAAESALCAVPLETVFAVAELSRGSDAPEQPASIPLSVKANRN